MHELLREDLEKAGYVEDEIRRVDSFLSYMCVASHEYVVKVFTRAKKRQPFQGIMRVCEDTFNRVWRHGTSDRIGDVDDINYPKNWIAFQNIYLVLGMGCPNTL